MNAIRFDSTRTQSRSFSQTLALVSALTITTASAAHAGSSGTREQSCEFRMTSQGRLDGAAANAPLSLVLEELSRTTGIDVVGNDGADESRISFAFRGIAVAEALVRILSGRSYTISAKRYGEALRVVRVVIDGIPAAESPESITIASDSRNPE